MSIVSIRGHQPSGAGWVDMRRVIHSNERMINTALTASGVTRASPHLSQAQICLAQHTSS
jgi:hypothetical protein